VLQKQQKTVFIYFSILDRDGTLILQEGDQFGRVFYVMLICRQMTPFLHAVSLEQRNTRHPRDQHRNKRRR